MKVLYSISVFAYSYLIFLASFFNKKAKLRYIGVKDTFKILQNIQSNENIIWFHCASLGEFEQGRPLIEKIKHEQPQYKIALSFFSPSGFEVQKQYQYADYIFYLPGDSKRNAKKLIRLLHPKFVIFIKYEFWHYYLSELKKRGIETILVSGIFRKNQVFFKFYGSFYRKILKTFKHLFVQNNFSKQLLNDIHITNVTVTGDTRFDRVFELSKLKKENIIIENFIDDYYVFIAGSTWKPDEELILKYINHHPDRQFKYIIAPHEIKKENLQRITSSSKKKIIKFSEANNENVKDFDILLIDNIGMLSTLYAYANIAYVGGGFSNGIHNILEAAVNGIPIIFGPNYQKFEEAIQLTERNIAFPISDYTSFSETIDRLVQNENSRFKQTSEAYINENIGATDKIYTGLRLYFKN